MEGWHFNPPPDHFNDAQSRPYWGVVVARQIEQPDTLAGREVSKNPNVLYSIRVDTTTGPELFTLRAPNQNRYDCWFYPAPINSIAWVAWSGPEMYFTVHEIPATEDC